MAFESRGEVGRKAEREREMVKRRRKGRWEKRKKKVIETPFFLVISVWRPITAAGVWFNEQANFGFFSVCLSTTLLKSHLDTPFSPEMNLAHWY